MTFMKHATSLIAASLMMAACASDSTKDEERDKRPPRAERGERPAPPDFEDAAAELGVSEIALEQALRDAGGPPPDFDKAAATLGVSPDALKAALPPSPPRRR